MLRIITQILIGLMLLFGVINLAPRIVVHFHHGNVVRALYFLLIVALTLFLSVMAFYFAYGGIMELRTSGADAYKMASVLDRSLCA
jgi:hypothetical protein